MESAIRATELEMQYKYITYNNLDNKQNYMYSEYGGQEFLDAYRASRLSYMEQIKSDKSFHDTRLELWSVKKDLSELNYRHAREILDSYVKRFEVSKRLYTEYNGVWKATGNASYEQLDVYILLSECCIEAYAISECTKYLSCALKIDDTLLSLTKKLTDSEGKRLKELLMLEMAACDTLVKEMGKNDGKNSSR